MIVGIDLGTTHSLAGIVDAGFPVLVPGPDGNRITPSVVHYPGVGDPVVGAPAARAHELHPGLVVRSVKRWMGVRAGEHPEDEAALPFPIAARSGEPVRFEIGGRLLSPEDISAEILRALCRNVETTTGQVPDTAVITVPAYFNDAQRAATKRTGELAGLDVARILNEPTAAALAYGMDRLGDRSRIAVYDFGGGTFDISILELNKGVFEVLATCGDTRLGGDDLDSALMEWFLERTGLDASEPGILQRLREACTAAKHRLSDKAEAMISLPFAGGGRNATADIPRSELERLAAPFLKRAATRCQAALADARLGPGDLDAVLLVGGSTRIPAIRQNVEELFGIRPDTSQHPDEAVAIGATIQAGVLSGRIGGMTLLDVTPLSLGIETFGGLMNVIIPRNTTIPTKAGEMFTNAVAGQRTMAIHVLQGEREMVRDNWTLGRFDIDFQTGPKGSARVGVQFRLDANGILEVLARDTVTGFEKIIHISSTIHVDDEAVESMIAQSVDHAFDDMSERRLAETRIKAGNMLDATRAALALAGGDLPVAEAAEIERLATGLGHLLESGPADALRSAMEKLDQATAPLAAHVVERAMEDALRKKGIL